MGESWWGATMTSTSWSSWDQSTYYWVVICKNAWFHRHANTMFGHKIPLGETDAVTSPPAIRGSFVARCDECGKEYSYVSEELMRLELAHLESFTPHPLFQDL